MAFRSLVIFWMLAAGLSGCSFGGVRKGSIIVIAVEGLAFDSFSCDSNLGQQQKAHGFRTFCEESVRFTHAYATSPMAAPSIASILTGRFPVEHGVRDNGRSFLSGKEQSVAESAVSKGYRTAFFSSGPPVLYKSGLGQGFEIFKSAVRLEEGFRHGAAESLLSDAYEFLLDNSSSKSLSFVYLSDLQYPNVVTKTDEGEIRSQTTASQLSEVDESIGQFVDKLKSSGRWDPSVVVLVGLNGGLLELETREERGLSLYSENVQVKLFIKPARKKRDKGLQWKVDQYVSLSDLGETLFDLIDFVPSQPSQFETISLKPATESLDQELPKKRMMPIESSWSSWREVGVPRLSVRMDQYLYIFDKPTKFYNTIYDRDERSQIDLKDPLALDSLEEMERFVREMPYERWRPMTSTLNEKLLLARNLFASLSSEVDILKRLKHISNHRSWDDQVWGWRANLAIKSYDWAELKRIGEEQGIPSWRLVSVVNLGDFVTEDDFENLKGCDVYLFEPKRAYDPQVCDDETLRLLILWANAKKGNEAEKRKEAFLRKLRLDLIDKAIYNLNYLNGLTWSTDIMTYSKPSHTDLALTLTHFQPQAKVVKKRFKEFLK